MQFPLKAASPLLFLGLMSAPLALSDSLQFTFSGLGSGSLGSSAFSDKSFQITFSSDTSDLTTPSGFPKDVSTPEGTPAVFTVDGVASGSLTGDQAVFVNDSEEDVGIWVFAPPDFLTIGDPAFSNYKLSTAIGPINMGTNSALSEQLPTSINNEVLSITSVSALSFTAKVGASGVGGGTGGGTGGTTVPEPSTLAMFGASFAFLIAAKLRRKAAAQ
jgi:hypothetical protein